MTVSSVKDAKIVGHFGGYSADFPVFDYRFSGSMMTGDKDKLSSLLFSRESILFNGFWLVNEETWNYDGLVVVV